MPGRSSCTMQSYALPRGRISCVAWFSGLLRKGLHGARFLPCLALTMGVLCPASPCAGNIFSAGSLSGALFAGYSPPGVSLSGALWTGRIAPANADTGGALSGTPASGHPTSGRYTSGGYQGIPSASARPSTMVIRGTHALPEAIKLSQNEPLPLTMPQALVIVTHPTDVIDCEDHVVSFKVVISGGTDPITYTWQRMRPAEPDFTDLPAGAPNISYPTPGTLRIDNVGGFENPGGSRYRVVITDPSGSVTSSDALLTVNEITDILPSVALPSKTNVILCGATVFSYTVFTSGTPPVAYQWKKYASPGVWSDLSDNAVISGSQGPVLTFTHPTPAESGQYKVHLIFHATGADCNVSSDSRIRVVTFYSAPEAPVVTAPAMACLGLSPPPLVATPASGGSGTFLCQWQESSDGTIWSDIPEACALEYQPPVATADRWYRLVATDTGALSCGNVTSAPCFLPVTDCLARHYRTIASGAWHNPTIWETSADGFTWGGTAWTYPTAGMRTITIREGHQVMVGQDLPVDQVTVEAGGGVTVLPGVVLTNTGTADDFTIQATSASAGSLIVPGSFAGKVTHQVQLRSPPEGGDYHYVSPPVSGETIAGFIAGNTGSMPAASKVTGVWHWEEPQGDWQELTASPGAVFTPGRGYNLAQNPGLFNDGLFSFRGWPVSGVTVAATSPYADMVGPTATRDDYDHRLRAPGRTAYENWGGGGWNLLGNPFNAALLIADPLEGSDDLIFGDEFLEVNGGAFDPNYQAVYVYDGETDTYRFIGHNTGGWDEPLAGAAMGAVPPGQGFFILAMNNTSVFHFTPEMQVHAFNLPLKSAEAPASIDLSQASKPPPYTLHAKASHKSAWIHPGKSSESAPNTSPPNAGQSPAWPGIRLFVRSGSHEASTLVVFNDAMTEGLDPGFDIGLMSSGHDPEIFTSLVEDNGNWFARQALPLAFVEGGNQVHYDEMGCDEALWGKGLGDQNLSHGSGVSPAISVIPVGVNSRKGGSLTFTAEIRLPGPVPCQETTGNSSESGKFGARSVCPVSSVKSYSGFGASEPIGISSVESGIGTFFLEDRALGIFTDLQKDAYTAVLPANTSGTSRFFLHFSLNGLPPGELPTLTADNNRVLAHYALPTPELRIVAKGNELLLFGDVDTPACYEIIDLSGRILDSGPINSFTITPVPSASGEFNSKTMAKMSSPKMLVAIKTYPFVNDISSINRTRDIPMNPPAVENNTSSPYTKGDSLLPRSQMNPLHLPLPRQQHGLLMVRISTRKSNIVYKFLNNP